MVKKSVAMVKRKPSSFSGQLQVLEKCLIQDYAQLEKAYPKALAEVDKVISRTTQELKKFMQKSKIAKGAKAGRSAKATKSNDTASLEKELIQLKAEKTGLQAAHKKFIALKKVLQQFEKAWVKKSKKTGKPRKSSKKTQSMEQDVLSESTAWPVD